MPELSMWIIVDHYETRTFKEAYEAAGVGASRTSPKTCEVSSAPP
jgi:hypothetical protein